MWVYGWSFLLGMEHSIGTVVRALQCKCPGHEFEPNLYLFLWDLFLRQDSLSPHILGGTSTEVKQLTTEFSYFLMWNFCFTCSGWRLWLHTSITYFDMNYAALSQFDLCLVEWLLSDYLLLKLTFSMIVMSEGRFIFHFAALPLEVARPI